MILNQNINTWDCVTRVEKNHWILLPHYWINFNSYSTNDPLSHNVIIDPFMINFNANNKRLTLNSETINFDINDATYDDFIKLYYRAQKMRAFI
jgi:hypothetical protein